MTSPAHCTECGRDTPPRVHLCVPCLNDPDLADYRTEWEIWEQETYEEDMAELWAEVHDFNRGTP